MKRYFGEIIAGIRREGSTSDLNINVMNEQRGELLSWPARENKIWFISRARL